jgi:hypothetical protein
LWSFPLFPDYFAQHGTDVFLGCTGIAEIRFDDGSNDLKINEDAFKNVWPTEIFFGRQMNLYQIATYSHLKAAEFGENVTSIETDAFETATELRSVTSRSSVPPRIVDPFNDNTYLWGTLYVPTESIDTYKSATGWRDFWEILSISDSGISEVDADGEPQVSVEEGAICVDGDADVRIVSMNGTTVYSGCGETRINLTPGVYVVIINNRATKVAVK